jgi:hypothetical protein
LHRNTIIIIIIIIGLSRRRGDCLGPVLIIVINSNIAVFPSVERPDAVVGSELFTLVTWQQSWSVVALVNSTTFGLATIDRRSKLAR